MNSELIIQNLIGMVQEELKYVENNWVKPDSDKH